MDKRRIEMHLAKQMWGQSDLRNEKQTLFQEVSKSVRAFTPITANSYSDNPIQLLDFFSGAGGTSLGFAALNSVIPTFRMLGGCDINKISAQTYSRNYGTCEINQDIVKLAYEDGLLEDLLAKVGYDKSKPTILIGCAPCQGFSSHRKKHWNKEDDIRNSLILAFAHIVEKINPEVIIMENVPEFLSKRYWHYFSVAKTHFEKCGYTVKQNIYNAAMFGVPQERFRSIVIGMKKEFLMPIGYFRPEDYRTVREAIGELPAVAAGVACSSDPMHKSASHKVSTIDVIK